MDYLTDENGGEAVAFIDKNRERPWFVYLPLNVLHGPCEASEKYTSRFPVSTDH